MQDEVHALGEQRKSEAELCRRLQEELQKLRQVEEVAGSLHEDNARLREELCRCREELCGMQNAEQKYLSCKVRR